MTQSGVPDPEHEQFENELGALFAAARKERSACPDPDRIAAMVAATLPESEAADVERHIELCGRCDALAARMRSLENTMREPRTAWRIARHPGFGYAIAAGLLVFMLFRGAPKPAAVPVFGGAVLISLTEAQRGSEDAVRIGSTGRLVVAQFPLPAKPDHAYLANIEPGPGGATQVHPDSAGVAYYFLGDPGQFGPGRHTLVVRESDPAGRETGRIFRFPFVL
jgi:hypothetical protein